MVSSPPSRSTGTHAATRQEDMLALINRGEVVSIGEFAIRFKVSHETIRRDIRVLEEAGQLRRVHGGAAPMRSFDLTSRRPIAERLQVDRDRKVLAAHAAMGLLEDQMNVYLDGSSTVLLLAETLARSEKSLTITTNMVDVAMIAAASGRCSVTLLGGVVNPQLRTVGGYELLRNIEGRLFDLTIMGAGAISPVHGILSSTKSHNVLAETLVSRSHQTACVLDSAKFGRRDAHVVLPLGKLDFLATDEMPPPELAQALDAAGVRIRLPHPEGGDHGTDIQNAETPGT